MSKTEIQATPPSKKRERHPEILYKWRSKVITKDQINEEEIGNLPEKEFRVLIVKMIQNLRNRMGAWIKKTEEMFNKDLEELMSWLFGKDPDAGKDWGQEEKGTTVDEMAGWHHQLDGHEFG